MFYSHEVLTSREHGVATVWLVATLGSRSILKKVGRKDILQVDVGKACRTIVDPTAPMALRLQSNLLYGVSRVYLEQCNYVLGDAQAAHNHMRNMLQISHTSRLDIDHNRTSRPELLLLVDDPAYMPEFDSNLPAELLNPGLVNDTGSQDDHLLSPQTPQTLVSLNDKQMSQLDIVIPSNSSADLGAFAAHFSFSPSPAVSRHTWASELHQSLIDDHLETDRDALTELPEADFFDFDAAGAIIDPQASNTQQESDFLPIDNDGGHPSETVPTIPSPTDIEIPPIDDDHEMQANAIGGADQILGSGSFVSQSDAAILRSRVESSTASAPQGQLRTTRRFPVVVDRNLEVGNSELRKWSDEYAANMANASRKRQVWQASRIAKRNADFWLWQSGIGGIGPMLSRLGTSHPLNSFFGEGLKHVVLCKSNTDRVDSDLKRPWPMDRTENDEGIDAEGRRVRSRHTSREAEFGRGLDVDMNMPAITDPDVEASRRAETPLLEGSMADASSAMPWNFSTASHASGPGSLHTVSASPLARSGSHAPGRWSRLPSISSAVDGLLPDLPSDHGQAGSNDQWSGTGFGYQDAAAHVDPHAALDQESDKFLNFVRKQIAEGANGAEGIAFDRLLPRGESSTAAAAQGLLHVLTLGSIGLLGVKQEVAYGEMLLTPTSLGVEPVDDN